MAKTIQDYKNDYAKAQAKGDKAGMQKAHAGAEAIRAQSGYSGGVDGSQHIPLPSTSKSSSNNKSSSGNKGSSSSKSTSSASKSSSGSSNKKSSSSVYYASNNSSGSGKYNGSAQDYDRMTAQAKNLASAWHSAKTQAEKDRLHDEAAALNRQLGKTYDSKTGVWSGGYARPDDVYNSGTFSGSAEEWDEHNAKAKQYAMLWNYASTPEQKQQLHDWAAAENTALGKTYEPSTGKWYGGYARPEDQPTVEDLYAEAFDQYYGEDAAAEREAQIRAANQAAVNQNILALNAQKDAINRAGAEGNAAAEQAYMQSINPNGSLAESLAANGLLTSGLTESSQIAAGNAYQAALNKNN